MKTPEPTVRRSVNLLGWRASLLIALLTPVGCKSVNDSRTLVATPVSASVATPVDENATEGKIERAVFDPSDTPDATTVADTPEKTKDAASLAAEAEKLVNWSSSESALNRAFQLSGEAASLDPTDKEIALLHARHALRLAEISSGLDRPAEISRQGLKSMENAGLTGDSLQPVAAYYHASLTGLVLRAQGLGAAGKLPELEAKFQKSLAASSTDEGGPMRALGMLYLKAPAWPTGIGDIDLALENLEKAAAVYGDFPYNHICLARAQAEEGQAEEAKVSLAKAEQLLAAKPWGALGSVWRREMGEISP